MLRENRVANESWALAFARVTELGVSNTPSLHPSP